MTMRTWRTTWRTGVLVAIVCLIVAGCVGLGYQLGPNDRSGPIHGDSGGAGGGSM